MGIQIEFNPGLALRKFGTEGRAKEECVPERLKKGIVYDFLKKGQRNYYISDNPLWDFGEIPLMLTEGGEKLSRPVASVKILEATHFLKNGEVWTRGKFKVIEVFDVNDSKINFEAFRRIKDALD
jgi:hypothetical protein